MNNIRRTKTVEWNCDSGAGVDAFFHALYALRSRVTLLLGSACEDVSESLAKVVPYWNIVQMSFGSTSPLLSDRHEFPLFSRTAAPQSSHDAARTALLRAFGWDSVAALSQDRDVHSLAVNSLVTALELANISCRASVTFAENDFDDQLTLLKDLDTRIILGSFSREVAPNIFCKALGLGVVGEDYAWVLQGAPEDAWWTSPDFSCEAGSLGDAVEGLLLVSSYGRSPGETPSDSGLTYDEFVGAVGREAQPVSELAGQTFDAVWALGLALRNAQRVWSTSLRSPALHDFSYHRNDMASEFLRQIARLNFTGVSGPVSFRQADRIGISLISQVQGGVALPVALFHPARGALEWLGGGDAPAVRWAGGHTPVSRRVCVLRVITVSSYAFLAITCLAALGMLVAVLFLAFNLHYRRLKYIKLSSPRLNNMAAVGCVLVYAAVILLGIDHATLPNSAPFSAVCTARVYLLSAGFSLAFGSMFTKTYRLSYAGFYHPRSKVGGRNDSEASSPGSVRGRVVPPHIAVLAADDDPKRKFSLAAMCVMSQSNSNASDDDEDDEVVEDCPGGGGSSGRLRVRGSPRFPHRVVPVGAGGAEAAAQCMGSSRLLSAAPRGPRGGRGGLGAELAGARCRSLEDARGMRRSSLGSSLGGHGANGLNAQGLGANYPFRAISLSPNCDVWAIKERGIPFTDFAIREKFLRAQREQLEEKLLRHQQQQQQQQREEEEEAAEGQRPGPAPADCSDGCVDQSPGCQSERTSHERTQD
ncbi:hypothetical protein FOCC_FOCC009543 [Frankliniella occidentalis]|nr:hypothetical protein FOCC_FOCC009543 [Frankliniella occidentalis]